MSFAAQDGNGATIQVASQFDSGNGVHYPVSLVSARPIVHQFVDSLGTGAGTTDIVGNYSGGATDFWIEPPAGEIWHIRELHGFLRATGNLRAEYYDTAGALANGIKVIHEVNSVENDLTDQQPVQILAEWFGLAETFSYIQFGAGDEFATWIMDFAGAAGAIIELDGDNNDKLIVRVNDDLTGLNEHRFLAKGHKLVGS